MNKNWCDGCDPEVCSGCDGVLRQAKQELEDEQFRDAVEKEKERLRKRVPLLHRLFPWKIIIVRRSNNV